MPFQASVRKIQHRTKSSSALCNALFGASPAGVGVRVKTAVNAIHVVASVDDLDGREDRSRDENRGQCMSPAQPWHE
jgi:hypothetical protein